MPQSIIIWVFVCYTKVIFQLKYSPLERGYTRDWLPAYSFVLRAWAMVLTGERTLSDMSQA
jgi:hypothetical protein